MNLEPPSPQIVTLTINPAVDVSTSVKENDPVQQNALRAGAT